MESRQKFCKEEAVFPTGISVESSGGESVTGPDDKTRDLC